MPVTYSLLKTSTKGAVGHWTKKLNAEMYIQQLYPSLADILWKQKNKTNRTQMQKKTLRKEGEIPSRPSGRKVSCYSFKSFVVSAWAQLEHVEKIYGVLSWLAWGKEEVPLWGQAQEIICVFLQFFNTHSLVLLTSQSFCLQEVE